MKNIFILNFFLASFMSFSQEIIRINSEEHLVKNRPFSQAIVVNDIIYLSGQIGTLPDGQLVSGGIEAETKQVLTNIQNLLESMGSSMDAVFKCTCMLENIQDWPKMSAVYTSFFKKDKLPSRSAFAGSGLAAGAKIEIECMAVVNSN